MMMPGLFRENNLFNDFMGFDFPDMDREFRRCSAQSLMRTDVKELENGYEVDMELPGYKKEDVRVQLKDGYLTVSAVQNVDQDKKDENGKYIRRERYMGSMSRRFYVGKHVREEDIHAKFADGVLKLELPKEAPKKVEESGYISIEG